MVKGCNGDVKSAATLLMAEKIEQIVQLPEYLGEIAATKPPAKSQMRPMPDPTKNTKIFNLRLYANEA
ncbi:MAG: hypothetical protein WC340_11810 [Kiritimatiellia bacterium]